MPFSSQILKPLSEYPGLKSGLLTTGVRGDINLVRPSMLRMDLQALIEQSVMQGLEQSFLIDLKSFMYNLTSL